MITNLSIEHGFFRILSGPKCKHRESNIPAGFSDVNKVLFSFVSMVLDREEAEHCPLFFGSIKHYLTHAVRFFVWRFAKERFGPPWFALNEMHRLVRRALGMVAARRPSAYYNLVARPVDHA